MNPFDLSGPQFLVFYIGIALIVVIAMKLAIDMGEGGAPPALPLGDPYQIAWLRGGTPEAARIAVLSLIDRSLLVVDLDDLVIPNPVRSFVLQPIESAILARCAGSRTAATDVLNDPAVEQACASYQAQLEQMQLAPDAELEKLIPTRVAIVEVTLTDGTHLSERVDRVRGTPDNPMTREEVVAKARELMTPVLGAAKTSKLIDRVLGLDNVKNIRELRPLLQATGKK